MKSGGYLALVNPCSGGHIGPQTSSSSDVESSVKELFGPIQVEDADSDQVSLLSNFFITDEESK